MKHVLQLATLICLSLTTAKAQAIKSDFDGLTLNPNSYWNGSDGGTVKGFASGDAFFVNSYHADWAYWDGGFAYSNTNDITTAGYTNDFSAITGTDYSGDGIYAPAQSGAIIRLTGAAVNTTVTGFYLTNSTYAALSMENGDQFAKKFGGATGNDADYFKLIVTGYSGGIAGATTVEAYLADFRNSDNSFDYILKNWRWVDLRPLGNIDSVVFSMASSDMTGQWLNTPAYFVIDEFNAPLFSAAGGQAGSTAISKSDVAIVNWAQTCTVTRGPQDISSEASPLATFGTDANATGPATGTTLVSLGDGGNAVLTFEHAIKNGTGADFAVFENGFTSGSLLFAELAFVEVSSDGEYFFRFPAVSNTSATVQNNSTYLDPQLLYNLAGSAQANYGTPFDLQELSGIEGLDIDRITHVRIVDVVGSLNPHYATYDKNGNPLNDPWTTAFPSSGFDLDAVAVLHESAITGVITIHDKRNTISVYPNPAAERVNISFVDPTSEGVLKLLDITGNELASEMIVAGTDKTTLELASLKQGVYILLYNGEAQQFVKN
ncbi:MAG: hypothetical protein K0R51_2521 [Cytophagaceae bacterium]|jgi:hypothetical protein|nr:hypothetical protein [Cytophagaceae bacterium]